MAEFSEVKQWVSERTRKAFSSFSLIGYYLVAIFFFGNLGLWIALAHLADPNFLVRDEYIIALITTIGALFGSASADIVFLYNENYIKAIPCYFLFVLIATIVPVLFPLKWMQLLFSIISFLLVSYLWFLANAEKTSENYNPMGTGEKPSGNNQGVQADE